jgi:uncharacterized membrane protein YeaQ/YmgE (transglycosylase-associated protein family)
MGIFAWIILGLVAGMVAEKLVPGRDRQGFVVTTLIGIAGALLGGFLAAQLLGLDTTKGFFNLATWITAIVGAVFLLYAYHLITGQGSDRGSGSGASRREAGRK